MSWSWPEIPQENCCVYCGELATTRDHVIPKSRGGRVTVPACMQCNNLKADKVYLECMCRFWTFARIGATCNVCNKRLLEVYRKDIINITLKYFQGTHVPAEILIIPRQVQTWDEWIEIQKTAQKSLEDNVEYQKLNKKGFQ